MRGWIRLEDVELVEHKSLVFFFPFHQKEMNPLWFGRKTATSNQWREAFTVVSN